MGQAQRGILRQQLLHDPVALHGCRAVLAGGGKSLGVFAPQVDDLRHRDHCFCLTEHQKMDDGILKAGIVSRKAHLCKQLPPVDFTPWHSGQLKSLRRSVTDVDRRRVALYRTVAAIRVQVLPAALHHIGIKALCGLQQGTDCTGQ